ncbi:MAG: DegT/DnrJ/EryC1/StrS family aminotransferase [Caldilineaceae bacterium]|nr:DegT/DnrJ/EryC1/StrS family aminotransferase [Caldilineaceae bacterium]
MVAPSSLARPQFARHVPPTATPLRWQEWQAGLHPAQDAVAQFRRALASYLDVSDCALAASGRTALFLLLRTLCDRPALHGRTEVILPAYTCPSVAKVVLDAGLTPRLVDIDPYTHAYVDGGPAANAGPATLALLCVHPYGLALPVNEAMAVARAVGAVVVEDAAQALGARYAGRAVGTHGDFGLFSLGPGKPLSTGGGGVVCARDATHAAALARTWQRLAQPGVAATGWALARLGLFSLAFHPAGWWLASKAGAHKVGDHEASWGYALRGLTASQAAVGLRLLPSLDAINAARRARAQAWLEQLQGLPGVIWPPAQGVDGEAVYLRLPLVLQDVERADGLQARLAAAGIGAGRMYRRTLDEIFPALRGAAYPGATQVARGLLTLPTNHYVDSRDIRRGAAILRQALADM